MTKLFLITRPMHEKNVVYLHDFSKEIVKMVKAIRQMHIIDLEGEKATRVNLEKNIGNAGLVFLNGHGGRKSVTGHKDEIILDERNIEWTKGKIVYAVACDSLEQLGEIAIQKGARAYIGYKARFMIVVDPSRSSVPSKDKNALPFKRAYHALISSLVFGSTVSEAIERTKQEYVHSIRSYGTSEDDPYGDTPLIRFALAWNLAFLDMCGDQEAAF